MRHFEQCYGLDYNETFASVVKPMSYKAIISLAAIYNWELEHMDIKMAFFYDKINKEVYVKQLTGFFKNNKVCYFNKTLYGL